MSILGLDISTSNIGYCIFKNGELINAGAIELPSKKCMFEKAVHTSEILKELKKYKISRILIEENLQSFRSGFSSAKTISTLAKFNGIISYISNTTFNIKPEFINVNHARKKCGIKIDRKSKKNTKEQVLEWVSQQPQFKNFDWPTKILKNGPRRGVTVLKPQCYDIADAAVLCIFAN